jgi:hypothetical protein
MLFGNVGSDLQGHVASQPRRPRYIFTAVRTQSHNGRVLVLSYLIAVVMPGQCPNETAFQKRSG